MGSEPLEEGWRYYCALCLQPVDGPTGKFSIDFRIIIPALTGELALMQVETIVPAATVTCVFPIPVAKVPDRSDNLLNT